MTQVTAGEKKLLGLGRYRFRERLSTSFFGGRFEVAYDGAMPLSEPPAHSDSGAFPASLRPRADMPLAMRLLQADTQLALERLSRSVQSVRDLEHRAVMRPLQLVRSSTRLGVITPNIEGVTLSQLLQDLSARQATIPPAGVVRIALDVLEGLEALRVHATAARRQDWLFGGLTPDSIFIGADGQSRLLDPGLTGAAARQPQFANEPAVLAYTAPEQTGPDATFDVGSDVFALGVMLWEMLTGRALFGAETAAQTLENVHRAPIERVQRHQFVRGEPIAFALAQAVAQALRRQREQRFESYDSFTTALTQAGPVASPNAIAELVRQAVTRETIDEIKARIASAKADAASAPVTTPSINLHSLSMPPARPSSAARPKITQVSARPSTPEQSEPAPVASAQSAAPASGFDTVRMQAPVITQAAVTGHDTLRMQAPVITQTAATGHDTLRMQAPVITQAAPANDQGVGISQPPRISITPRRHPSLSLRLQEQVSAFPIGDLLRTQQAKHSKLWPLAAAAVIALGIGTWLVQRRDHGADRPAAVSGHAPQAPAPQTPAPVEASPTPVPPLPPPAADALSASKPAELAKPAATPAARTVAADGGVQTAPDGARAPAANSSKRRSKSEARRGAGPEAVDIPEPPAEPRRETPPEPQAPPGKFIPEDI